MRHLGLGRWFPTDLLNVIRYRCVDGPNYSSTKMTRCFSDGRELVSCKSANRGDERALSYSRMIASVGGSVCKHTHTHTRKGKDE